jgi:hypothetical protein
MPNTGPGQSRCPMNIVKYMYKTLSRTEMPSPNQMSTPSHFRYSEPKLGCCFFYLLTGWPGTLVQGLSLATSEGAGCQRREMTLVSREGFVPSDSHRTPWLVDPSEGLEAGALCWSRRSGKGTENQRRMRAYHVLTWLPPQGWPVRKPGGDRHQGTPKTLVHQGCTIAILQCGSGTSVWRHCPGSVQIP